MELYWLRQLGTEPISGPPPPTQTDIFSACLQEMFRVYDFKTRSESTWGMGKVRFIEPHKLLQPQHGH